MFHTGKVRNMCGEDFSKAVAGDVVDLFEYVPLDTVTPNAPPSACSCRMAAMPVCGVASTPADRTLWHMPVVSPCLHPPGPPPARPRVVAKLTRPDVAVPPRLPSHALLSLSLSQPPPRPFPMRKNGGVASTIDSLLGSGPAPMPRRHGAQTAQVTAEGIKKHCGSGIKFVVMAKDPVEQIHHQRALKRNVHLPSARAPACEAMGKYSKGRHRGSAGEASNATTATAAGDPAAGSTSGMPPSFAEALAQDLAAAGSGSGSRSVGAGFPSGCAQEYIEPNLHAEQIELPVQQTPHLVWNGMWQSREWGCCAKPPPRPL